MSNANQLISSEVASVIDALDIEYIAIGGGNRTSKIILAPEMLLRIPNVEVVENLAFVIPAE